MAGKHGTSARVAIVSAVALLACSALESVPRIDGRYALERGERIQVVLDDGRELLLMVHAASAVAIVGTKVARVAPSPPGLHDDPARADAFPISPNQLLGVTAQPSPSEPELIEIPLARIRSVQRDRQGR